MIFPWNKVLILSLLAAAGAATAAGQDAALPVFTDITEQTGIHFKQSYGDLELTNIV